MSVLVRRRVPTGALVLLLLVVAGLTAAPAAHAGPGTFTASPSPSVEGQEVTLTYTLDRDPALPSPTGTVTFFADLEDIGEAPVGADGVATTTWLPDAAGGYDLTARYSGNHPADEVTITHGVGPAYFLLKVPRASQPGDPVTLVAAFRHAQSTGTVSFFDGDTLLGTVAKEGFEDTLELTVEGLALGDHQLSAVYSGDSSDPDYPGATSTRLHTVRHLPPNTLTTSANPAAPGQRVTLTFTVARDTVLPTPTGTVEFEAGAFLVTVPLDASGVARTSYTPTESTTVFGTYSGDRDYGFETIVLEQEVQAASGGSGDGAVVARLAGTDRYTTAVAISQDSWPSQGAQSAVLARGDAFPDALAGTPLAVANRGPLLLTPPAALSSSAASELRRVLPAGRSVYLLGGPAAISPAVADAVARLGYRVVRLAGQDRYSTAVAIGRQLGSPSRIFLATGLSFQDALVSGVAAAGTGGVVVLTADAQLPAASRSYLDSLRGLPRVAVGAPASAADPTADRIAGGSVYETARLLAERYFPAAEAAAVASGTVFADALAGGAHVGGAGGPLLLSEPTRLPPTVGEYLSVQDTLREVTLYGGPAALSAGVQDSVQTSLSR